MGGTGANPHARDLSVLTPRELKVYNWACAEHAAGRYPGLRGIRSLLGCLGFWVPQRIRANIIRKVGWPCRIARVPSGSWNLTPKERDVLMTAIVLVEDGKEYPSILAIQRLTKLSKGFVIGTRRKCVSLKIWPCRVKSSPCPYPEGLRELVCDCRCRRLTVNQTMEMVEERFGRSISAADVWRILRDSSLLLRRSNIRSFSLEERKSAVIEDRRGKVPAKLDDPAAYRRACRSGRSRKTSTSRPVQSSKGVSDA